MRQLRFASFALAVGTATLTLSLCAAAQTPPRDPVQPLPAPAPAYAPPPPWSAPPPPSTGQPPPPPGYGPPPGAYYPPPGVYYGPPPYPPPATERRSIGAMIAGIVLTSVGGSLLIGAAVGESIEAQCDFGFAQPCTNNFTPTAVGLVVGGLVGIAVGIPLLVYGARRVPIVPGGAPPQAQAFPTWAGAPGGAGWVWRF